MWSDEEIKRAIEELDSEWELKEGKIVKSFDVDAITKRDINLAKEIQKVLANSSSSN